MATDRESLLQAKSQVLPPLCTLCSQRTAERREDAGGRYSHLFYLKGSRPGVRISVIADSRNQSFIQKSAANLSQEFTLQSSLQHPHIVQTASYQSEGDFDFIIMEHCVNGDLLDRLKAKGGLSEKTARKVTREVTEAVEYCHEQGVAHLDIKPENVFFDSTFTAKLGDFGHSRFVGSDLVQDQQLGTQDYMAPEMHAAEPYDGYKADIFSAGIVLFMTLTAHRPFAKAAMSDQSFSLLQTDPEVFWSLHEQKLAPETHKVTCFPAPFKDLVTAMTRQQPDSRPSWDWIKSHLWMVGETATKEEIREELRD